jgi:hypothetical protein
VPFPPAHWRQSRTRSTPLWTTSAVRPAEEANWVRKGGYLGVRHPYGLVATSYPHSDPPSRRRTHAPCRVNGFIERLTLKILFAERDAHRRCRPVWATAGATRMGSTKSFALSPSRLSRSRTITLRRSRSGRAARSCDRDPRDESVREARGSGWRGRDHGITTGMLEAAPELQGGLRKLR